MNERYLTRAATDLGQWETLKEAPVRSAQNSMRTLMSVGVALALLFPSDHLRM